MKEFSGYIKRSLNIVIFDPSLSMSGHLSALTLSLLELYHKKIKHSLTKNLIMSYYVKYPMKNYQQTVHYFLYFKCILESTYLKQSMWALV